MAADDKISDVTKIQSKCVDSFGDGKPTDFDRIETQVFADFETKDNRYLQDLKCRSDKFEIFEVKKGQDFESALKEGCVDANDMAIVIACQNDVERDVEDNEGSFQKSFVHSVLDAKQDKDFIVDKISYYREFKENLKRDFSNFDTDNIKGCKDFDSESTRNCGLGESAICDEEWDSDGRPTGERWPPLGAPNDDEDNESLHLNSELCW